MNTPAPLRWVHPLVLALLLGGGGLAPGPAIAAEPRPNFLLILADDLGWSDLACYGADLHETTNLDRLAREGVRFTQAYAMPVCSPTRAALLTGRHAARLNYTVWREAAVNREAEAARTRRALLPPVTATDLPHAETTLAEALQAAGYLTLHVGKWHLGAGSHYPETHGFDVNLGGTHWGASATYFHPFRGTNSAGEFRYVPGLGPGRPGEELTDRLTDEALRLIDTADGRPFFLNLWLHTPHTPVEAKPERVEYYRRRLRPGLRHQNAEYAAMIHTLDENVGRLLTHLEARGLASQTLVLFTSDNGGYDQPFRGRAVTDNHPLRSGKGSLYEGGIRVPLIVRMPGLTPPGGVCPEPVVCMDFFPTLASLAGVPAPTAVDGLSLVPLLRDPAARLSREALFFHFPHYYPTTSPVSAVRAGDWKLLEYYEGNRAELYHLAADPSEQRDLAGTESARLAALRSQLHQWREAVGARPPTARAAALP